MITYQMGKIEERFADIIWENEPVPSGKLVKICAEKLGWKKSTMYTVLRQLCGKGIFINKDGFVRSCISKDDFYAARGEQFVDEAYGGSVPAFLAAFLSRRRISEKEANALRQMVDDYCSHT